MTTPLAYRLRMYCAFNALDYTRRIPTFAQASDDCADCIDAPEIIEAGAVSFSDTIVNGNRYTSPCTGIVVLR